MSWGCNSLPNAGKGYDVSVIHGIDAGVSDQLGIVTETTVDPYLVEFRDVMEVPGCDDVGELLGSSEMPEGLPGGEDDLDENIYPGLIHICKCKIGGWPTWVQSPDPPVVANNERLFFLGQFDWYTCENAPWCAGGYAFLFLILGEGGSMRGDLVIQTT